LKSNGTPLDRDLPIIHGLISDGLNRIDALDTRIDALRATLSELVSAREDLAEQVRQHRSIASPVRRVSTELLCLIFAFMVSDERYDDANWRLGESIIHQSRANEVNTPWRVSGVCRYWRASALSYPPLW
ncbi:hypothetical protein B0H19DRAFT_886330, partial [Mycena capillaripes]